MSYIHRRWFLSAVVLLSACSKPQPPAWQGYAEGEYLALAAPSAGYLSTLDAPRGTTVTAGSLIFTLATDPDAQAAQGADARVAAAEDRLHNLSAPRRKTEIAALEANVRAAQATADLARAEYTRAAALADKHLIAIHAFEETRSRRDAADANLSAARETLATAQDALGRRAEIAGARSDIEAARADAAQKHWALTHKTVSSPTRGAIADTYYRPGEWVPSGAPVASLLPVDRRRIRFYVPADDLARLPLGTAVVAQCDGCTAAIHGTVDFVAPQAEYTPPLIYSRETRARMVFRVEAAPTASDAPRLQPGQALDVSLAHE